MLIRREWIDEMLETSIPILCNKLPTIPFLNQIQQQQQTKQQLYYPNDVSLATFLKHK